MEQNTTDLHTINSADVHDVFPDLQGYFTDSNPLSFGEYSLAYSSDSPKSPASSFDFSRAAGISPLERTMPPASFGFEGGYSFPFNYYISPSFAPDPSHAPSMDLYLHGNHELQLALNYDYSFQHFLPSTSADTSDDARVFDELQLQFPRMSISKGIQGADQGGVEEENLLGYPAPNASFEL